MPKWKPPTGAPEMVLYIQRWSKESIEDTLYSTMASISAHMADGPIRWDNQRILHYREEANDGFYQDLIYRSEDFGALCKARGVDTDKAVVVANLFVAVGVITKEERDEIRRGLLSRGEN